MNIFDKYFNKDASELKDSSKALVLKKVTRGFESTIDQLEETKLEIEESLEKMRISVANGNTSNVITIGDVRLELEDITKLMFALEKEKIDFVGK